MLDPEVKNSIREKISLKINEIKNPQTETADASETIKEPVVQPATKKVQQPAIKKSFDEPESTGNFWTRWKYQLISVPASFFALIMIVFAANNFSFIMRPNEDFSPKNTDIQTSVLDTSKIEDSALISEATPEKTETQTPELLVLDINDLGQINIPSERTLNKYQQTAETTKTSKQPVVTGENQTTTARSPQTNNIAQQPTSASNQTEPAVSSANRQTNSTDTTQTQTATQRTTTTSATSQTETSSTTGSQQTGAETQMTASSGTSSATTSQPEQTQPASSQTVSDSETTPPPATTATASLTPEVTDTTPVAQQPENQTAQPLQATSNQAATYTNPAITENNITKIGTPGIYNIEPVALSSYIQDSTVLLNKVRSKTYTTNYYTDASGQSGPAFDRTIIGEITADKSPSAVNVYYINSTRVIIEIVEGTTKKLYLYENKGDGWTVIKYEKN